MLLFAGGAQAQSWRAAGQVALPPGAVVYFVTPSCPSGWLPANGGGISAENYPALVAALGGGVMAVLPDLRGEFIRGIDAGRGVDHNRQLGSAQRDAVAQHTHLGGVNAVALTSNAQMGVTDGNPDAILTTDCWNCGGAGGGRVLDAAVTSGGAAETRPRNVALLACIKH